MENVFGDHYLQGDKLDFFNFKKISPIIKVLNGKPVCKLSDDCQTTKRLMVIVLMCPVL